MKHHGLGLIKREIKSEMEKSLYDILSIDLAAACAYMHACQTLSLGLAIMKGTVNIKDVPARHAPGEMLHALCQDGDLRSLFRITAAAVGGAQIACAESRSGLEPFPFLTFAITKRVFPSALKGIGEDLVVNIRFKEAMEDPTLINQPVEEMELATVWYWIFHQYHVAAERIRLMDALLDHFTDIPSEIKALLQRLLKNPLLLQWEKSGMPET